MTYPGHILPSAGVREVPDISADKTAGIIVAGVLNSHKLRDNISVTVIGLRNNLAGLLNNLHFLFLSLGVV